MIRVLGIVITAILSFFVVSSMIVFTAPYFAILIVLILAVRFLVRTLERHSSAK